MSTINGSAISGAAKAFEDEVASLSHMGATKTDWLIMEGIDPSGLEVAIAAVAEQTGALIRMGQTPTEIAGGNFSLGFILGYIACRDRVFYADGDQEEWAA